MIITVKLYGTHRRFSNTEIKGIWKGELQNGSTILDIIETIGAKLNEVAAATINGKKMPFDYSVNEDTEIILVTHMGGG